MILDSAHKVPYAPFYVLSDDTFMSGWGHARGKRNTIILPCQSLTQARIVEANAVGREDQTNVRILVDMPILDMRRVCYSVHGPEDYKRWYTPGSWSHEATK